MKNYLLSYNSITKEYYLDYGAFDRFRENLGKLDSKGLIKKLQQTMPMHRKILLYVEHSLNDEIRKTLEKSFRGRRINIESKKEFHKEYTNPQL